MIYLEMQFEKKPIPYLRSVMRQVQTQEQTQEVRLPEGMPDVGRVIGAWGQPLIRGKEWRSGGMSVTGGVMMWVLYAPEDGSQFRCIDAWLPFHGKWEFDNPEQDGVIRATAFLRSADARLTSARKILVRSSISLLGEAMCQTEAEICEMPELPEDIHILKNQYVMRLPAEAGEKAFSMEETLPFSESMPAPAKLLRYELRAEVTEQRLLSDKLIFRGEAIVHILYADHEGHLYSWESAVPFSQYTELDRAYPDDATADVCIAVTNLELLLEENGVLTLKAGMTGQYRVFDSVTLPVVEDAYSTERPVQIHTEQLKLPAVLDDVLEMVTAQIQPENTEDEILDAAFYPEHGSAYHEDGQIVTELTGNFQLLCEDPEGQIYSKLQPWQESRSVAAASTVQADTLLMPTGQLSTQGDCPSQRLKMELKTVATEGLSTVTGLSLGEQQVPDPDRPSLILCAPGQDSLWDLAKRTGSTVEAIMEANGLQQAPEENRILLIPVL